MASPWLAQEVKALAAQTAKATDEIGNQIAGMQAATQEAVGSIKMISSTIGKISEITSAISAVIEEQGAATQEISGNIQRTAAGTTQVAGTVAEVSQGATQTGAASRQLLSSATHTMILPASLRASATLIAAALLRVVPTGSTAPAIDNFEAFMAGRLCLDGQTVLDGIPEEIRSRVLGL